MSREELYHTIEQYLEKQLDAEAHAAFESRLSKEPELRHELELHRKIQKELGDPAKRNLRAKLDKLRAEHTIKESTSKVISLNNNRTWLRVVSIAAGILLFGFLIWLLVIREPVKNEIVEDPVKQEQEKIPSKDIFKEEVNPMVEDPVDPKKETIAPNKEKQIKEPIQDALANIKPNPVFEKLIRENGTLSQFDFEFESEEIPEMTLAVEGNVTIQLKGQVITSYPEDKTLFRVFVYDNKAKDYTVGLEVTTFSLPVIKRQMDEEGLDDEEAIAFAEKEIYDFNLAQKMKLSPGLYYYTLSLEQNPRVLYCNRFTVVK